MSKLWAAICNRYLAANPAVEKTYDPCVFITHREEGKICYVNPVLGLEWETIGTCDHCCECIIGAVVNGKVITSLEMAKVACSNYKGPDVPVGPWWDGCPDHQLLSINVRKLEEE